MNSTRRRYKDDEVIMAWPWFGGTPGKAARKLFAVWVTLLVLMTVMILLSFITRQICLAIVLILVTAVVAILPTMFLFGSRI